MSCIHHPDKAYVFVDGQLICPECGRHSPYQPMPSYDQILAENKQLLIRIATLEKDVEYYKKMWLETTNPNGSD